MAKTSIAVVRRVDASRNQRPKGGDLGGHTNWGCFEPPGVRLWGSPICLGAACRTKPGSLKRGLAVCLEWRVHLANGAYPDRV